MGGITDALGLSDNAGQKRATEQQAEAVRRQAEQTRKAANETARAAANKQSQEANRAAATTAIEATAAADTPEAVQVDVGAADDVSVARKRAAFQVSGGAGSSGSGSIRI